MRCELALVTEEARKWGLEVAEHKPEFHVNNGTLLKRPPLTQWWQWFGIDWPTGTVVYHLPTLEEFAAGKGHYAPYYPTFPLMLLHEISHLMQPVTPNHVDEIDSGMLWMEYRTAKTLGLIHLWEPWMKDYGLYEHEWGDSPRKAKVEALTRSRDAALKLGLIKRNGHISYRLPDEVRERIKAGRAEHAKKEPLISG